MPVANAASYVRNKTAEPVPHAGTTSRLRLIPTSVKFVCKRYAQTWFADCCFQSHGGALTFHISIRCALNYRNLERSNLPKDCRQNGHSYSPATHLFAARIQKFILQVSSFLIEITLLKSFGQLKQLQVE